MKNRLLAFITALALVLTLLPAAASGEEAVSGGSCGEDLFWELDTNGVLTVSGEGVMTSVPWYEFRPAIRSAVIGSGVTEVCDYAFWDCPELRSVTVPDSVTVIGDGAFGSCVSLTQMQIPNSVTVIGDYAFWGCSALTELSIGSSVTVIGSWAFSDCSALNGVTFGSSLQSIGEWAFNGCSSLSSVVIPGSAESIGDGSFCGCSALADVTIPDSVTSIGKYAFKSCSSLMSVFIPATVKSIGYGAFGAELNDLFYQGTQDEFAEAAADAGLPSGLRTHCKVSDVSTHGSLVETLEPTCTEIGYDIFSCACSSGSYYTNYRPAKGHDFVDGICSGCMMTEEGYTAYFLHPGQSLGFRVAVDGIKKPTMKTDRDGILELGCKLQLKSVLTHYYDISVKALSLGQTMLTLIDQNTGDEIGTVAVRVIPHDYSATEVTAPTCTGQGSTTYVCSCGDSFVGSYVKALGHDYRDGKCTRCGAGDPSAKPKLTDIDGLIPSFRESILWAVENGITTGYDDNTFRPNNTCTRGHVVTFLWRAAGSPQPISLSNPFRDVSADSPYFRAILWAAQQGITTGYDDGTFRPNAACTRAHVVTFLWRYENKPTASGSAALKDLTGLNADFTAAIRWAAANGITTGYEDGTFRPAAICTRAHVVTFLYRALSSEL